jgi:hypothetical protein
MFSSDRFDRQSILILDTGPIRELVTYHAVYHFGFSKLRQELKQLTSVENYQNFSEFLATFRKKMTSTSVIAELHWWIRETDHHGQIRLWTRVREEFERMGMDEDAVTLLAMDIELLAKLSPTDVSLLEIARRNVQQHPVILTVDGQLHTECRKAQVFSRSLSEACMGVI